MQTAQPKHRLSAQRYEPCHPQRNHKDSRQSVRSNGKIFWQSGQLPSIDVNAMDVSSVIKNIQIQQISVRVVPSTVAGEFGSNKVQGIGGSSVNFGAMQKNGSTISVPYSVSKLPGTPIQLLITPQDEGNFVRVREPVEVDFSLTDSVANNFDFVCVPVPT